MILNAPTRVYETTARDPPLRSMYALRDGVLEVDNKRRRCAASLDKQEVLHLLGVTTPDAIT